VLVQIDDRHVCAFFRVKDRNGPSDPAIAARDERDLVPQLATADILARSRSGLGSHLVFAAGLLSLVLGWPLFFLFRHGEWNRFWGRFQMFWPRVRRLGAKKSSFF
jgi:hypothetical protein